LAVLDGRLRRRGWGRQVLEALEPWVALPRLPTPRGDLVAVAFGGRVWALGGWSNLPPQRSQSHPPPPASRRRHPPPQRNRMAH
jgi:hypothetical protein